MKKLVVIILMLAYGFSSMGMTVHLHYCCGKLKSIEWLPVKESGDKCKMSNKGCCDTKEIANKTKTDQLSLQTFAGNFKVSADVVQHEVYSEVATTHHGRLAVPFNSPPLHSPPLFILHSVFRI